MCPANNQPIELASGNKSLYTRIDQSDDWHQIDENASFVHYCQNETVHGF
jgi:phosphoserine aminotransferase